MTFAINKRPSYDSTTDPDHSFKVGRCNNGARDTRMPVESPRLYLQGISIMQILFAAVACTDTHAHTVGGAHRARPYEKHGLHSTFGAGASTAGDHDSMLFAQLHHMHPINHKSARFI